MSCSQQISSGTESYREFNLKTLKNAHVLLMDSQDVDVMTNHIITLLTLQSHAATFCLVVAIQLVESFYKI